LRFSGLPHRKAARLACGVTAAAVHGSDAVARSTGRTAIARSGKQAMDERRATTVLLAL
jgi:hypothetical protein